MDSDNLAEKCECDIALRLEALFREYVALYTKLYKDGGEDAGVPDERFKMAVKLESANQEMSELVLQLQYLQSDTELAANDVPQTISASKISSKISSSVFA